MRTHRRPPSRSPRRTHSSNWPTARPITLAEEAAQRRRDEAFLADLRRLKAESGEPTPEPSGRCHGVGCPYGGEITVNDGTVWCRSCFTREGEPGGRFHAPYAIKDGI